MFQKDPAVALKLAMEAEHESEQVHNVYQHLADNVFVEKSMDEVQQATDISAGLENLEIVLESLGELNAVDVALVQVVGDIAGAGCGVSGDYFTPAMESLEDHVNSFSEKAKAIYERAKEILRKIYEKIVQLHKYAVAKFQQIVEMATNKFARGKDAIGSMVPRSLLENLQDQTINVEKLVPIYDHAVELLYGLSEHRTNIVESFIKNEGQLQSTDVGNIKRIIALVKEFDDMYGGDKLDATIKFSINIDESENPLDNLLKTTINIHSGTYEKKPVNTGEAEFKEALFVRAEKAKNDFERFAKYGSSTNIVKLLEALSNNARDALNQTEQNLQKKNEVGAQALMKLSTAIYHDQQCARSLFNNAALELNMLATSVNKLLIKEVKEEAVAA